jgi:hypothetical protein
MTYQVRFEIKKAGHLRKLFVYKDLQYQRFSGEYDIFMTSQPVFLQLGEVRPPKTLQLSE